MLRRIHSVSLSVIFLFSIGTTCCVAADELVVTFQMSSPDLPENTPVYITGSVPELGNWRQGRYRWNTLEIMFGPFGSESRTSKRLNTNTRLARGREKEPAPTVAH